MSSATKLCLRRLLHSVFKLSSGRFRQEQATRAATDAGATVMRQPERKLHSNEAQFASLADTAIDGFVIAHTDGQIQWVNQAIVNLFGYDRAEEMIGHNLHMLMPSPEASRHDGYLAAHCKSAPPRVIGVPGRELLAVRRDGSEFPIDLSVSSFCSDGTRFFTGIIRDASARKEAEVALRDSETRLRLVQRVGGIAYYDRKLTEFTCLISEEFARLYDLPAAQMRITIDDWIARIHPEDRDRIVFERKQLLTTGGSLATEFRICRPDGTVHWVFMRAETFKEIDGEPTRIIVAQQDITEIVAAREARVPYPTQRSWNAGSLSAPQPSPTPTISLRRRRKCRRLASLPEASRTTSTISSKPSRGLPR